ncbi:ANKRD17, partial [Symbiodinium microadriaticum]
MQRHRNRRIFVRLSLASLLTGGIFGFSGPDFAESRPAVARRMIAGMFLCLTSAPAQAEEKPIFRTTKESPEIPQVLAVMLLRSTYDAVEDWGAYSTMADYQRNFALQLRDGFQSFRGRYENYDLSDLYNTSKLLASRSGGVTNRFYFSFLNDAQWRVIGRTIRRPANRERFGQFVGERLYQSILRGEELKSDVPDDSPGAPPQDSFAPIGQWPKISALTRGGDASSLTAGARQLLQYLLERGYCESFEELRAQLKEERRRTQLSSQEQRNARRTEAALLEALLADRMRLADQVQEMKCKFQAQVSELEQAHAELEKVKAELRGKLIHVNASRDSEKQLLGALLEHASYLLTAREAASERSDQKLPQELDVVQAQKPVEWQSAKTELPIQIAAREAAELRQELEDLQHKLQHEEAVNELQRASFIRWCNRHTAFEAEVGEATQTAGIIKFTTFVGGPVNLDATASLMRSNENFAPRYDQRILQAYFAECGFRAIFQDGLAENATSVGSSVAKGTRALWTLTRETDSRLHRVVDASKRSRRRPLVEVMHAGFGDPDLWLLRGLPQDTPEDALIQQLQRLGIALPAFWYLPRSRKRTLFHR